MATPRFRIRPREEVDDEHARRVGEIGANAERVEQEVGTMRPLDGRAPEEIGL